MSTVYNEILDKYLVICVDHPEENELGVAAFATNALLAPLPDDDRRRTRLTLLLATLQEGSVAHAPSTFRAVGEPFTSQIRPKSSADAILHEGFMVVPSHESGDQMALLHQALPGQVIWADPAVWRSWGSKSAFRVACRELLGERAITPGLELFVQDADAVFDAIQQFSGILGERFIVKLPGVGGAGNIVVDRGEQEKLTQLRARMAVVEPVDVVIEKWLPWEDSYSISYFLPPGGAPRAITICRQQVDKVLARFSGSTDAEPPVPAVVAAVHQHLEPLFAAMAASGYYGVVAVDFIVGRADAWANRGLPLPGGLAMCVIECNPRFNRHNRVGLLVERLARHWGASSKSIRWTLRDSHRHPIDGAESFADDVRDFLTAPARGAQNRLRLADRSGRTMELAVSLRQHRE